MQKDETLSLPHPALLSSPRALDYIPPESSPFDTLGTMSSSSFVIKPNQELE